MVHRMQQSGQPLKIIEEQMKKLLLMKMQASDKAVYNSLADEEFCAEHWERLDQMSMTPGLVLRSHLPHIIETMKCPKDCEKQLLRIIQKMKQQEQADAPWDEQTVQAVSAVLERESADIHGINLRKRDWAKYLLDKQMPQKREMALMIILITKMDQNAALDFLLTCAMEPLSAREVWDSIVMFCVQTPGAYTWHDVKRMEEAFQVEVYLAKMDGIGGASEKNDNTMSQWLPELMATNKDKSKKEAMADFVVHMAGRHRELWDRKPALEELNGTVIATQIKVDGFSMGRYLAYQRLAQYLAVFYRWYETEHWLKLEDVGERKEAEIYTRPLVYKTEKKSHKETAQQWQQEFQDYLEMHQGALADNRVPTFGSLYKALLFHGGLVIRNKKAKNIPTTALETISIACGIEIVQWANTLKGRMHGVDRIPTSGKNLDIFQRRDALMFIYFFLHAYSSWMLAEDDETLLRLKEKYVRPEIEKKKKNGKAKENQPEDTDPYAIKSEWLNAVATLYDDSLQKTPAHPFGAVLMDYKMSEVDQLVLDENGGFSERMDFFHICFDYLLQGLGYTGLYLQNRLDRTLLMVLTRGDSLETLLPAEAKNKLTTFKVTEH